MIAPTQKRNPEREGEDNLLLKKQKYEDKEEPFLKQENSQKKTTVVHLKRSHGKIIQDCDIYIGRRCNMGGWSLPDSKWANPFSIKEYGSAEKAIQKFKENILKNRQDLLDSLPELKGKTLGCW